MVCAPWAANGPNNLELCAQAADAKRDEQEWEARKFVERQTEEEQAKRRQEAALGSAGSIGTAPDSPEPMSGAGRPGMLQSATPPADQQFQVTFYHSPHPTTSPGSLDSADPCPRVLGAAAGGAGVCVPEAVRRRHQRLQAEPEVRPGRPDPGVQPGVLLLAQGEPCPTAAPPRKGSAFLLFEQCLSSLLPLMYYTTPFMASSLWMNQTCGGTKEMTC